MDDASTMAGLSADLTEYIGQHLPIVKYKKLNQRNGLIKARVIGAKMAQADVFVFLDSHCETYHNWLPPLLGKYMYKLPSQFQLSEALIR